MADFISNPVDADNVPRYGPMAEFVHGAMAAVSRAELDRMEKDGNPDPSGVRDRIRQAKLIAIAEWNQRQTGAQNVQRQYPHQ